MNRTGNNISLVCYDITSDKLRRKIDKAMKDFGIRIQFSLFLCRLDTDGVIRCRDKLKKILHQYHNEKGPDDSLIIFDRIRPEIVDCLLGARIDREPPRFEIL